MRRLKLQMASIIIYTLCFLIFVVQDAYAYLDPGTGSYILQLIIAGLLGLVFTIKICWRKIIDFFSKVFRKGEKNND